MRWDRSVTSLETLLADPASSSRLDELKARLRLVNDRLSDDAVRSAGAYRELLARRLEAIDAERGGAIDGAPDLYEALQRRLDSEQRAIREELRRLGEDRH